MRFAYLFFIRLGFLDGPAGFHYCAFMALKVPWIGRKMAEVEDGDQAELAGGVAGHLLGGSDLNAAGYLEA